MEIGVIQNMTSATQSITPGIYRLIADVPNPGKVDRRRTDWPNKATFKTGTLFIFRRNSDVPGLLMVGCVSYPPVWQFLTVKRMQAVVDALTPQLEVLNPRSSLSLLTLYYSEVLEGIAGPGAVLGELVKDGTLTLDQVEVVLKRLSKLD